MRNHIPIPDENFLKVHPDLAALYEEVQEKENALKQLNLEKKVLKEEIRAVKNELKKRLAVIDAWQSKVEAPAKKGQRMR